MPLSNQSVRFLQAAFGLKWGEAWVEWWKFDSAGEVIPETHRWSRAKDADPPADSAVYYCTGLIRAGGKRCNADVESVHILVLDDVGTKIDSDMAAIFLPIEPRAIVETSKGNFQYVWFMPQGVSADAALGMRAGLKKLFGKIDGGAPSMLARLPQGVNGKPGKAKDPVQALNYRPKSIGDPLSAFPAPPGTAKGQTPAEQAPSLAAVEAALKAMPNDGTYGYDQWIEIGIALRNCRPNDECRDLFIAWSARYPLPVTFDPAEKWETFPTNATSGWGTIEIMAKTRNANYMAAAVFDDGEEIPEEEKPKEAMKEFEPIGASKRPIRPWLYGGWLIRGYMSATIAGGGIGKSSLTIVEALSMASGKDLLGVGPEKMPRKPLSVHIWNGEDPEDDIELRLEAACHHYGISRDDLGGRLTISSGRDNPMKLVKPAKDGGVRADVKRIERLEEGLKARKVDVLIVDPLVSAHYVKENDNMQMDVVAKTLGALASRCGCAVHIVHHTRKGQNGEEASVEDARGAGAVTNAARYARVLTPMPKEVGERHAIPNPRAYFCVQKGAVKTNLTPPLDSDLWYHIVSVDMGNGDPFPEDGGQPIAAEQVGVVEKWAMSAASADRPDTVIEIHRLMGGKDWRHSDQTAERWVGVPVGQALGLDISNRMSRKIVKDTIDKLVKSGALKKVSRDDENRKKREFVEIGDAPEVPESEF